jgi:hypothetical protein
MSTGLWDNIVIHIPYIVHPHIALASLESLPRLIMTEHRETPSVEALQLDEVSLQCDPTRCQADRAIHSQTNLERADTPDVALLQWLAGAERAINELEVVRSGPLPIRLTHEKSANHLRCSPREG